MRRLLLHIGHGKTGSTWIQSSLRSSVERLKACGIDYPLRGDDLDDPLRMTSGNGFGLLQSPALLRSALAETGPESDACFSSEFLFGDLTDRDSLDVLRRAADGFDEIRLLLFTRDPVAHASSLWQQQVKRRALTSPLDDAFLATYRVPSKVLALLDAVDQAPEVSLEIHNYSRVRHRLLEVVAEFLGVASDVLVTPPASRVNRSLTSSETAFQLRLNDAIGLRAEAVANALCERLPDLVPDAVRPDRVCQERLLERLRGDMESVNAQVPAQARYRFDDDDGPDDVGTVHCFDEQQLGVIAEAIGALLPDGSHIVQDSEVHEIPSVVSTRTGWRRTWGIRSRSGRSPR